jgi:hypothetical protein
MWFNLNWYNTKRLQRFLLNWTYRYIYTNECSVWDWQLYCNSLYNVSKHVYVPINQYQWTYHFYFGLIKTLLTNFILRKVTRFTKSSRARVRVCVCQLARPPVDPTDEIVATRCHPSEVLPTDTEESAVDLGSCLGKGKPTVHCLLLVTTVFHLKIHWGEIQSCLWWVR